MHFLNVIFDLIFSIVLPFMIGADLIRVPFIEHTPYGVNIKGLDVLVANRQQYDLWVKDTNVQAKAHIPFLNIYIVNS